LIFTFTLLTALIILASLFQAVFGVTINTPLEIAAFKAIFQTSTATLLDLKSSAVTVDSVTPIVNNRRLMDNMYHQRPFLQAATGVTVGYSVAATGTSSAVLTTSIAAKASALSSILVTSGYTGATVQAPVVLASAPTGSPGSSGAAAMRSDTFLTAGVIFLTVSAILC
jgi:hypothetical protein